MKIDSQQSLLNTPGNILSDIVNLITARNFTDLKAGNVFKAKIVDIQPDQVTLQLNSGNTLTAKSLILPEARIGDESFFIVKESSKGQILLEMLRPGTNILQNNMIKEALLNAGLFPSAENITLARALLEADMPIDSQTLQKAAFFHYSDQNGLDIDKVLFLLQENFPPDKRNIDTLNGIMDKTIRLTDNISGIIESLFDIDDETTRKNLLAILLNAPKDKDDLKNLAQLIGGDPDVQQEQITKKLKEFLYKSFHMELRSEDSLKETNNYYKTAHDTVTKMLDLAHEAGIKSDLINHLTNLKDGIEFMNHVGHGREYLQIPFSIDGQKNNGELYVFKDRKRGKNNYEQANVLIALDCVYLGHIEAFINKNGNSLNIQMRGDRNSTLAILGRHITDLGAALSRYGYVLSGVTFRKINEPFTLTNDINQQKNEAPKRYTFDMRV